ncbi:hypothetical protein FA95DRAFT_1556451 [Auriscalpium vulgare]|uniref:Uncharacterized protein n=1 Tax=Auriscalpium vulgare TaxID=40419 RepID=A0ACB8RZV4_9AGAM|nr:hypothetical protein FA95DRAFT_1556451 [Auriscalpium vulgare]
MSVSYGVEMFGLVAGVLSTIALIFTLLRFYLPSARMRELDTLMEETESLFHDAQEQGLLIDPAFVSKTRSRIASLRHNVFFLRNQVYSARTVRQQTMEMLKGLSLKIGFTCEDVKVVRATISSTSAEQRKKLEEQRQNIEEQGESQSVATLAGSSTSCEGHGEGALERAGTFSSDTTTLGGSLEEMHDRQGETVASKASAGWEQLPFAQVPVCC